MMKHEFEALVGQEVKDEEWKVIETVYVWYNEDFDKETIAKLWCLDKKIIYDMYPRAKKIEDILSKIAEYENRIRELKKEIRELEHEMQILQTQP